MTSSGKVFTYLRYTGIGLIIISVIAYLFRGLHSFDDFSRFLVFSGLTVAMIAFGVFSAKNLKDKLTARIFMTLGLLSVPALSALYGGVLFSTFGDKKSSLMPGVFNWTVSSNLEVLLSGALLLLVGLINSRFGYKVLNNLNIKDLLTLFVINNIILILPFRSDLIVFGVAAIFFTELYYLNNKKVFSFKTLDEFCSIFASLLPLFILVGRSAFYSNSMSLITAVSCFMGSSLLYAAYLNVQKKSYLNFSAALACISGLSLVVYIDSYIYSFTQPLLVGMLVFTGCMQLVAKLTNSNKSCGEILALVWSFSAVAFFIYTRTLDALWIHAVYTMSGVYVAYVGTTLRHKWLSSTGMLFTAFMVLGLLWKVFHNYIAFNWLTLALVGAVLLILTSFLEKKGKDLLVKYNQLFKASTN